MSKEQQKMKGDIKMNEKDKLDLKREIKTRDNIILDKENEITVLKRELRHMENTKFVFQHKITALQDEIKPKDNKIDFLKQQILDMEVSTAPDWSPDLIHVYICHLIHDYISLTRLS